jgi:YVTN family beta-propeller protein
MKTKSVVLLSTLATAALLLIAVFVLLAAFSLTAGLTLAAPPDAPGSASVAATAGLADGISTSNITATVKDELGIFPNESPTLSASAVYTVEAESSEVTTIGTWHTYTETACSASNGQVIYSGNANDKVSYTFTGTQVTVLYQKQSNTGFMDVLVDGLLRQQVDTYYGGGKQCQQAAIVSNLPYGSHTVEAVVVGDRNPSSSGDYIVVDAFILSTECGDAYEPDNDFTTAVTVTVPSFTSHNFDVAYDTDWVVFSGTAGITYTIKTMNLAISGTKYVDTKLVFYWWDGSGLVHLATRDDNGDEPYADEIIWPITTTGWYYVNVGHVEGSWSFSGCDAYYDLRITGPPVYVYLPIILKNHLPPPPTCTPTATTSPPTPGPPPPASGPCYPLVERTIPVGNDPRGVAYNGDDNLIYVANCGDDTVSVINGVTYSVTKVITGVVGANGVAYDSNHGLVYVTNQSIDTLTVISATTNTIVETTPVGDQPHGVAYNPTVNKIYVANYGGNSVTVLDGDTRALITTVTVPGETEPAHIAVNPVTNKAYVTYHGSDKVGVIDGDTNNICIIDIYSSGPYGIAADTQRNLIYVVSIDVPNLDAPNLVTIDGFTDLVKSDQWGRVNIHKSDDSLVPLRVIAVHPELGPSAGGGHLYITSSSGDVAGDGSHGTDQMLMSRKGWPEGFNKPNPLDVGRRPEEGIAVDLANNRVFVTARDDNWLTVIKDTDDHNQLCSEAFALDGYVIEPVP